MSLPRFFLHETLPAPDEHGERLLRLDAEDRAHVRALRLALDEHIAVIDADSDYFECSIAAIGDDGVTVRVCRHETRGKRRVELTLVQGLAKGDKMDIIIRHATELGVSAFIPFEAERSVVQLDAKKREARRARWASIAKSAAMQSGQPEVPDVSPLASLAAVAKAAEDMDAVVICWEEADASASLREALSPARALLQEGHAAKVMAIIGPEGGLTEAEVDACLEAGRGASLATLGPSILRTETAGIVAPALVLYELGCMDSTFSRASVSRAGGKA